MNVLTEAHALLLAEERAVLRSEFLARVRADLRALVEAGAPLAPFPQAGSIHGQLRHELLTMEAEDGDPIARARVKRRKTKINPNRRQRIYQRDAYTCQKCGWTRPKGVDARKAAARGGRQLTIDHVIPRSQGGPNTDANFQTLCSKCNTEKGCSLPSLELLARVAS